MIYNRTRVNNYACELFHHLLLYEYSQKQGMGADNGLGYPAHCCFTSQKRKYISTLTVLEVCIVAI